MKSKILGLLAVGLLSGPIAASAAYIVDTGTPVAEFNWAFHPGLGGAAIFLILEATRRLVGWALVWITVPIILYANLAYLFPGILNAKGSSWQRIAAYLYLDSSGIFGLPLDVAAGIVVAFIFFGQALYAVGGDTFLTDIALVLMGRYRGGTAKVAVVSSTLFGTVSGSAVANVVVDGAITIPMMKKSGYPPHTAAAIEAVASNGGQIMPPVMVVAAFLMAEFLNISYGEVALAAAIPACLYYVALFTQIDLEAAKLGLRGMPENEIPKFRDVIKRGWVFLVPLGVLIYTLMFAFWEAGKAGMADHLLFRAHCVSPLLCLCIAFVHLLASRDTQRNGSPARAERASGGANFRCIIDIIGVLQQ